MKLKELDKEQRPREKFLINKDKLTNQELLAIILKTGIKNKSVLELSNEILERIDNINNLKEININSFNNIKGLGKIKTIELLASLELGKRVYIKKQNKIKTKITNPETIFNTYKDLFIGETKEHFYVIYLNTKLDIIEIEELNKGTVNKVEIHPREIYKKALLIDSTSIICMHNHPSGDNNPSNGDIEITNTILKGGKELEICLLDHIIFTDNDYFSFKDNNILL